VPVEELRLLRPSQPVCEPLDIFAATENTTVMKTEREREMFVKLVKLSNFSLQHDRALPVAAARAWNSLPSFVTLSSLSTFKRQLKTYLFATSY